MNDVINVSEHVESLIAKIHSGSVLEESELMGALEILESYECWSPYFRLFNEVLKNPQKKDLDKFIRMAWAQNVCLEDALAAADTCVVMVKDLGCGYSEFKEDVLPKILEIEDFKSEATFWQAVRKHFADDDDQVKCLERLCVIFEKKVFSDHQLAQTYEDLIDLDPHNSKALRYFKQYYMQMNDWEKVVDILNNILDSSTFESERFRIAQELAALLLYQLDLPNEAINTIAKYCDESPLDASTILYDAYKRLSDWYGCQRVLRECLLAVETDRERAVLHYKIALTHEALDEYMEARDNYVHALGLESDYLEPVEGLIGVAIRLEDWHQLDRWLEQLEKILNKSELKSQVKQARQRLAEGLAYRRGK